MVVSCLMGNSAGYRGRDYVAALLICTGATIFSYRSGRSDAPADRALMGVLLLAAAGFAEVVSMNLSQRLMHGGGVTASSVMLRQNFCCLVVTAALTCGFADVATMRAELSRDPAFLAYAVSAGLAIAAAVWSTTHLIEEAGSVFSVGVSTCRRVVLMVASYSVFPKPLARSHLVGGALVALGLCLPLRRGRGGKHRAQRPGAGPEIVACLELARTPAGPSEVAARSPASDATTQGGWSEP